jgi:hypothetical protein
MWCATSVKEILEKNNISHIEVHFDGENNHLKRAVSFDWDEKVVTELLENIWYPLYGSRESKSMIKKMKSFVSCAIGKIKS